MTTGRPLKGERMARLLAVSVGASAARSRTSGTLQLKTVFHFKWYGVGCPAGTPATTDCYLFTGPGTVRGLGEATETYTILFDQSDPGCMHTTFVPTVIAVLSKGQIDVAQADPYKCDPPPGAPFRGHFTISGGSGAYAGMGGSGTIDNLVHEAGPGFGSGTDTWSGPVTAPGRTFDLTPPAFKGAVSKTVRARTEVKRVRVKYSVTAVDAVDGPVPVSCAPRSGAFFRIGRTTVTCSASDSSANAATARFTAHRHTNRLRRTRDEKKDCSDHDHGRRAGCDGSNRGRIDRKHT
jgi:HYR domain-containing protein